MIEYVEFTCRERPIPTRLHVSITPPEGMRFTSIDAPLTLDGERVVYDGTPPGDLDLQVTFSPSLPIRIWRSLLHIGG